MSSRPRQERNHLHPQRYHRPYLRISRQEKTLSADDQEINHDHREFQSLETSRTHETSGANPFFADPLSSSFSDRSHSKDDEIRRRQQYRAPTKEQQELFALAHVAHMGVIDVMLLLPDGRERATAITVLENNRMVMNRAIALASPEDVRSALERYARIGEIIG